MHKTFDVLNKEQLIFPHCLIEASAGTGKTFTISHLVVRFLIEFHIPIEKILLVTFTRASARELKMRVRQVIEEQLSLLKRDDPCLAGYVCSIEKKEAMKELERALIYFDQAAVHTIHGCCERMLSKAPLGELEVRLEGKISAAEITNLIYKYLKEGIDKSKKYSLEEIKLLVEEEGLDALVVKLEKILNGSLKVLPSLNKEECSSNLLAHLALDCQEIMEKYLEEEEKYRYDDLLQLALKGCENAQWVACMRSSYAAVVIDEFQDTDALQWEIFRHLFLYEGGIFYLVGDPKQSIYAFRRADIYTYLEAAEAVGKKATLRCNFRSDPPLVCALNDFFSQAESLFPLPKKEKALEYESVLWKGELKEDAMDAMDVLIVEAKKGRSRRWPSIELQESYFLPFIAKKIIEAKKQEGVPWKEWAILVRDKNQAKLTAAFLQRCGIAFQMQKKENLADSRALEAMKEILEALHHIRDKGVRHRFLLGACLHLDLEELFAADQELILENLYRLKRTLQQEGMYACFLELMEANWGEQSTLEKILEREDAPVFLRDLEKIVQILVQEEGDIEALLLVLQRFEVMRSAGDERLEIPMEDSNAVRILTIHTSKGLEFSRVFALGIINRTQVQDDLVISGNYLVPSTSPDFDGEGYAKEIEAEKFRQLYVALTRAKHKLYLPILLQTDYKPPKEGTQSPMELFLEAALKKEARNIEKVKELFSSCRYTAISQEESVVEPFIEEKKEEILPPKVVELRVVKSFVSSFTSLTRGVGSAQKEIAAPIDFSCEEKSIHNLPAGIETGLLFHRLMEKLCFEKSADRAYLSSYVKNEIEGSAFEPWADVLVLLIEKLLKMEFLEGEGRFCDIDPQCMLREISFFYQAQEDQFIKGIADLLFLYQDKYYLLDWKTNWLQEYSQESLQCAMEEHHYFFQADLYKQALQRYLKLVDARPFEQIFGGVYYLFIRGLEKGVYRV